MQAVMTTQQQRLLILLHLLLRVLPTTEGRGGIGAGETSTCVDIKQPKTNKTIAVGDRVILDCTMKDFYNYEAMTCTLNNRKNQVAWSADANGCNIHFTAEWKGPLELSCTIVCAEMTVTYNMSWTASATTPTTPSIAPSTTSVGSGTSSVTSECGPQCGGETQPGDSPGAPQLVGVWIAIGLAVAVIVLTLMIIVIVSVIISYRKRQKQNMFLLLLLHTFPQYVCLYIYPFSFSRNTSLTQKNPSLSTHDQEL